MTEELSRTRARRVRTAPKRELEIDVQEEALSSLPKGARLIIEALAVKAYVANKAANTQTNLYKKARAELLGKMKDLSISRHKFMALVGEGKVVLEATISTPDTVSIDVKKLKTLVTEAQFFEIVSASKGAIEEAAGQAVYNQCANTIVAGGTENVSIGVAK